jgi:ABC-type branched-subunit amino acid transport system substrate-binding protein
MILTWCLIFLSFTVAIRADVIRLGAIFPISTLTGAVDRLGIQRLASFVMAVDDLNRDQLVLSRNLSVRFAIRDSKRSFTNTATAALELATKTFLPYGVHAVVGAGTNVVSGPIAYILQDLNVA